MDEQNKNALRVLVVNGLRTLKVALEAGEKATERSQENVTNAELKQLQVEGAQVAANWKRAVEAGSASLGEQQEEEGLIGSVKHAAVEALGVNSNKIISAIYSTGKDMSDNAESAFSRDLGQIAIGQVALHYFISYFGGLASYADALGMDELSTSLKRCGAEAKQKDEEYTSLAESLLAK